MLKNLITILLSIFIISGCSDNHENLLTHSDHELIIDYNENYVHELVGVWKRTKTNSSNDCELYNYEYDEYYIFFEDGRYVYEMGYEYEGSWSEYYLTKIVLNLLPRTSLGFYSVQLFLLFRNPYLLSRLLVLLVS